MSSIGYVSQVLAADVANNATVAVAYPTGTTKTDLLGSTGGDLTVGDGAYGAWEEGSSGFTVAYGASTITITNKSGLTWPSGQTLRVSFGTRPYNGSYNVTLGQGTEQAARQILRVQELTASGVVSPNIDVVELNHASVIIAATYVVVPNTVIAIKDTSATGTANHTFTVSGGTLNGTNTIATFNLLADFLLVQFDSAGNGTILANIGSVALS